MLACVNWILLEQRVLPFLSNLRNQQTKTSIYTASRAIWLDRYVVFAFPKLKRLADLIDHIGDWKLIIKKVRLFQMPDWNRWYVKQGVEFLGRQWNFVDMATLAVLVYLHCLSLLAPFYFNWTAFWLAVVLYFVSGCWPVLPILSIGMFPTEVSSFQNGSSTSLPTVGFYRFRSVIIRYICKSLTLYMEF